MNKICKTLGLIFLTVPVSVFCSECTQNGNIGLVEVNFPNSDVNKAILNCKPFLPSFIKDNRLINSEALKSAVLTLSTICSEGKEKHTKKSFDDCWKVIKENFTNMRNSGLPVEDFKSDIKYFAKTMQMETEYVEKKFFLKETKPVSNTGMYAIRERLKRMFNGCLKLPRKNHRPRKYSEKWLHFNSASVKTPYTDGMCSNEILDPAQNTTEMKFFHKPKAFESDYKNSNFKFCFVPQAFNPFADKKK